MQIRVAQEELSAALQTALRAVSSQSTLPILSGVKLQTDQDKLRLSTTNLEIFIQKTADANIVENGEIVIPARLTADIIKNLPQEEITLRYRPEENQVEISCRDLRFSVNVLEATDFPEIPAPEEKGAEIKIARKLFSELVSQISPAASSDDSRPVLTGALISIDGEELKLVATDSYRLALRKAKVDEKSGPGFQVIVPSRSVEEASKILSGDAVKITLSERLGLFDTGDTVLVTRLIDGNFPNYKQLLPENAEHRFQLNREELATAARRVSLVGNGEAPVTLSFSEDVLKLTTSHEAQEAEAKVKLQSKGAEFEICFNPRFLLDGLASIREQDVVLELESPEKPAILRGTDNGFLYLLMPVRLK